MSAQERRKCKSNVRVPLRVHRGACARKCECAHACVCARVCACVCVRPHLLDFHHGDAPWQFLPPIGAVHFLQHARAPTDRKCSVNSCSTRTYRQEVLSKLLQHARAPTDRKCSCSVRVHPHTRRAVSAHATTQDKTPLHQSCDAKPETLSELIT